MLTQQERTKNIRKNTFDLFFRNFIVLESKYGKIYTKHLYQLCSDPNLDFSIVDEFKKYEWDWNSLSKNNK